MPRPDPHKLLTDFLLTKIEGSSLVDHVSIFGFLSEVMPTLDQRHQAAQIRYKLTEVMNLETELLHQIQNELRTACAQKSTSAPKRKLMPDQIPFRPRPVLFIVEQTKAA
jgi:hypothetical protein